MRKQWLNWQMSEDSLKKIFEKSINQSGTVRIFSVLNHVSTSGMTRYISAYVPVIGDDGVPCIACIAREKRVEGCGMDMGFHLAYNMFMEVYGDDKNHPYQDYLSHSWM